MAEVIKKMSERGKVTEGNVDLRGSDDRTCFVEVVGVSFLFFFLV